MQGRLTSFQKTMLQWNDLHPYNAVHVVRMRVALDLPRLQAAVGRTLTSRKLAGVRLDRAAGRLAFDGEATEFEVRRLEPVPSAEAALTAEIQRQLNRPFAGGGRLVPFRFFVVPEPEQFGLGLVYFHPIGDAESVVGLLQALVEAYLHPEAVSSPTPLALYPRPNDRESQRGGGLGRTGHALRTLWRVVRTTCRPPVRAPHDQTNAFAAFALDQADLQALLATAGAWGITVNDLLLALLFQALAPLAPERRRHPRRRRLALGCIVNTRRDLGLEGQPLFGVVLGALVVLHEVPEGMGLKSLALDVHGQTQRAKELRLALATPRQLAWLRLVLRFFSTDRRARFYLKHYPLWGGLTNMNLQSRWPMPSADGPVDYWRAVSTGPATPLVFSITTVGDHVNVGVSYRPAVFSETAIAQVTRRFGEAVRDLRAAPDPR